MSTFTVHSYLYVRVPCAMCVDVLVWVGACYVSIVACQVCLLSSIQLVALLWIHCLFPDLCQRQQDFQHSRRGVTRDDDLAKNAGSN